MADNIVLLKDLEEHKFTLNYAEETNVRIGSTGTSTRPPFSDIVVWRIDEQEPQKEYHVKVLPNGIIFQGKFCPISSIWLILRQISPCE